MVSRNKISYTVVAEVNDSKILQYWVDFDGEIPEETQNLIDTLKPTLYSFIRQRVFNLIDDKETVVVRIKVKLLDNNRGRTIEFTVVP